MNYLEHMAAGNKALGLAEAYSEDGAPATAAERAEDAVAHFSTAARLKREAFPLIAETQPKISTRARKLLERLRGGAYYKAHDPKLPKVMQELEQAGLVQTIGRAVVFERCYVPAEGYTPMRPERYTDDPFEEKKRQALADLEELRGAVFGCGAGDEPDVYQDFDRLTELSRKTREALEVLSQC